MVDWGFSIILFVVETIISTIIIYIVTKLLGESGSIGRAFVTAIVGAVVYSVIYHLIGNGLLAAAVAGILWLFVLKALYNIGWLKSLVTATVIWVFAIIVSVFLPTLPGPL